MTAYVTRGELRAELHDFEQRMIYALGQMAITISDTIGRQVDRRIDQLRIELNEDIGQQVRGAEERVRTELRVEVRGSEERLRGEIRALEDPYRDLPARVATLEDHAGIKR